MFISVLNDCLRRVSALTKECVEDEMPSGEGSRNGRRAPLPEDPWEQVSESSRVADMSEQAQWERHIRCVAVERRALPVM